MLGIQRPSQWKQTGKPGCSGLTLQGSAGIDLDLRSCCRSIFNMRSTGELLRMYLVLKVR
jgi:hypothetical protein